MSEVQKQDAGTLENLAARINTEHRACEAAVASAVEHAIRAGEMLAEAKRQSGHGGWLPWLQEHFEGSEDTAQVYMRLARNRGFLLDAKTERARFSSIRGAVTELKRENREKRRAEQVERLERWRVEHAQQERELMERLRTGELRIPLKMAVSHTYDFEGRPEGLEGLEEPLLCRTGRPGALLGSGPLVEFVDQPDWSGKERLWHIWEALTLEPGDEEFLARLCLHPGEVDLAVTEEDESLECKSLDAPPTRALSWDGERLLLPTGHWRAVLVGDRPWLWWEWDSMPGAEILAAGDQHRYKVQWLETDLLVRKLQGNNARAGRSLDSAELEAALVADLEAVRAHQQAEPLDLEDARTVYDIGSRVLNEWTKRRSQWQRFAAFVKSGGAA